MERAKKHKEAQGKDWDPNIRQKMAELSLSNSGPFAAKGSVAVSMHSQAIDQQTAKYKEEDCDTRVEDALIKEIPVDQQRYISMKDGEPYCNLCKKVATESHVAGGSHLLKMEESAISDAMGGSTVVGQRRFGELCQGVATAKLIFNFWGDAITDLPRVAKEIHAKKGKFYINSKVKKPITVGEAIHELGIVSYSGTGKYESSSYIPFHDLPDDETTADSRQKSRVTSPGLGWWPVIALQKKHDKEYGRAILLVCFYQLQAPEGVSAWWIWPDQDATQSGYPSSEVRETASSSAAGPPPNYSEFGQKRPKMSELSVLSSR